MLSTIIEMWHEQTIFSSREARKGGLASFVNFYNTVKPHAGIDNMTPYEKLGNFFSTVNNARNSHKLDFPGYLSWAGVLS